ncbi:hypothetical protein QL285_052177 [Trifolium repens]|nr:hypothetical protein QL285_052177 [Trifolium repens]
MTKSKSSEFGGRNGLVVLVAAFSSAFTSPLITWGRSLELYFVLCGTVVSCLLLDDEVLPALYLIPALFSSLFFCFPFNSLPFITMVLVLDF